MPNDKFKNIKHYAKVYGISVLKDGKQKTVNQLSLDIWDYERKHKVNNGLYPFLNIRS